LETVIFLMEISLSVRMGEVQNLRNQILILLGLVD
jgi:hypothetical protein